MTIRFATINDIPTLVELGRYFHSITRFQSFDFNAERVGMQLRSVIEAGQDMRGTHCCFVAQDRDGVVIGALIGCVERHFFSDRLVASIIHYDVLPERRMSGAALRLMSSFRKWAENRGAVELSAGVNSGTHIDKTDKFLRRLGFVQTGGNYALALNLPQEAKNLK
jgi:L-amino acid N-acyltransferase YncA